MVIHLDWSHRIAYVQPTDMQGKSRWLGSGQALSFEMSQAIRRVLYSKQEHDQWSHRARTEIADIREEFDWVGESNTAAITSSSAQRTTWWTFGGMRANSELAERLRVVTDLQVTCDNLSIRLEPLASYDIFRSAREEITKVQLSNGSNPQLEAAIDGLKFSDCLPSNLATAILRSRLEDSAAVNSLLSEPVRGITT